MQTETLRRLDVDVRLYLRIPKEIYEIIEPAAQSEGLRLPSWVRRTLVMAARQVQAKQIKK